MRGRVTLTITVEDYDVDRAIDRLYDACVCLQERMHGGDDLVKSFSKAKPVIKRA